MQTTQLMTSLCILGMFKIADFVAYDTEQEMTETVLPMRKLQLIAWSLHFCAAYVDYGTSY